MALKKLQIKPGVNREKPRYSSEGVWYDCDKVRFRQGFPEKIGGWVRASNNTFTGLCRSLRSWAQLSGERLTGIGTSVKFYVAQGGVYRDITPLRATSSMSTDPFSTTVGSSVVTVTDANAVGLVTGDYVTFSGASAVGGLDLNGEFIATYVDATTFTIDAGSNATSTATGGGAAVTAEFQVNIGYDLAVATEGWNAGLMGFGPWGEGETGTVQLRIWNQSNFGEDLIYGPSGGGLYYWSASDGVTARGVAVATLPGASDVPTIHNLLLVSDISRYVFVFGTNVIGQPSSYDPMLIRWSAQEDVAQWTPAATNLSGSLRLSRGNAIIAVEQARQEVLVWTSSALYSLQLLGAPAGWGAQLVGENITIMSPNSVAYANGVAFWMGRGKFYVYDGTVRALNCDVRKYVFDDFNYIQDRQVFAGTNEEFHEIWWFYPSADSDQIDRYVIHNYRDNIWYYGTLGRTAWADNVSDGRPIAATYDNNVVTHEDGIDDAQTPFVAPIHAYAESAPFDIEDGDKFMFIRRMIPEVDFSTSTIDNPSLEFTLRPLRNPGAGYTNPASEGGNDSGLAIRSTTVEIDQYTEQLNLRARGRQMVVRVESSDLGVQWQLGSSRLDIRPDGRS